jgi:DNA methylase
MVADTIFDCTARGDVVLDAFAGSGTAVIAAERTGRRCYALEPAGQGLLAADAGVDIGGIEAILGYRQQGDRAQ